MTDATLRLIISLQDKASAGLKAIQNALGSVAGAVGSAAAGFGDFVKSALAVTAGGLIQKGIEGIASAVGDLKGGLIDGNAEFERYGVQFGVLLGGADAAKDRLSELAQFGATTPFELPQVVRADKILQSFGLHAVDAAKRFGFAGEQIRTIAGDTAAGTGADFEEISTYIGKFASGATGETIARFQELGIVTKKQLADMGLAFDKGGSLIINSQEDLDKATGILLTAMKQKYGGMMDAQSKTFEGMVSNLQDWRAGTLRIIGAPLFEVLRTHLEGLLAWLPSQQPRIEAFAQALAGGLARAIPQAIELARTVINLGRYVAALVQDGDYLNDWLTHLPASMRPAVETAGRLTVALIDLGGRAINAVRVGWAWLTDVGLPAARAGFEAVAARVSGPLMTAWAWLTGTALPALQAGWGWLVDTGLPTARDRFQEIADRLSGPLTTAWGWLTGTALPALQSGWAWLTDTGLPAARNLFQSVADTLQGPLAAGLDTLRGLLQPVADALQPVIDGFGEGGLAGGLEALGRNILPILGAVSDLRTNLIALGLEGLGGLISKVGEGNPILEQLGSALTTAGGIVRDVAGWFQDKLLPVLGTAAEGFGTTLGPHVTELGRILKEDVWPILQDVGRFIGDNLPGAINVVAPILQGLLDTGLSGLELALRTIADVWNTVLKPAFEEIGKWLEDLTGGWDNLAKGAEKIKESFAGVGEALRGVANGDVTAGSVAASAGGNAGQTAMLESTLKGIVGSLFPGASSIPGFAGGVSNFRGGLAMVGERGPELVRLPGGSDVIPAGRAGGGGAGGGMNVTVIVNGSVTSEGELIRKIQTGLIDIARRNGTTGIS